MMIVTPDHEGFWKAWDGPSPPRIVTTNTVTHAQPVHAMLIFSGCRAAADGNCNVSARLGITAPDGSAYGELAKVPVWRGPPAPGYNLQLSESHLGFSLEPDDAPGRYILTAAVTDHVAGITVHVQQEVTAERHR